MLSISHWRYFTHGCESKLLSQSSAEVLEALDQQRRHAEELGKMFGGMSGEIMELSRKLSQLCTTISDISSKTGPMYSILQTLNAHANGKLCFRFKRILSSQLLPLWP